MLQNLDLYLYKPMANPSSEKITYAVTSMQFTYCIYICFYKINLLHNKNESQYEKLFPIYIIFRI